MKTGERQQDKIHHIRWLFSLLADGILICRSPWIPGWSANRQLSIGLRAARWAHLRWHAQWIKSWKLAILSNRRFKHNCLTARSLHENDFLSNNCFFVWRTLSWRSVWKKSCRSVRVKVGQALSCNPSACRHQSIVEKERVRSRFQSSFSFSFLLESFMIVHLLSFLNTIEDARR